MGQLRIGDKQITCTKQKHIDPKQEKVVNQINGKSPEISVSILETHDIKNRIKISYGADKYLVKLSDGTKV